MARPDRTLIAVKRQLKAMAVDSYDIGIRDKVTGKMMTRQWDQAEIIKAIPWLKRQNAMGADIYIRPGGEQNQGLVLVDDLDRGQLAKLNENGLNPALTVETSPQNYQAWVKLEHKPLANDVATLASKVIAKRFGGDLNSADWRHFGRLAGFTNQKPEHTTEHGYQPFVILDDSNGQIAERGPELAEKSNEHIKQQHIKQEEEKRLTAALSVSERNYRRDPVQEYQKQFKALAERYGPNLDYSKADWMIGKSMLINGASPDAVKKAINEASPKLASRKLGHVDDYLERTMDKLSKDQDIQQAIEQRRTREHNRSRGPSLGH